MKGAKNSALRPHAAKAEIRRILVDHAKRRDLITYSGVVNQIRSIRLIARSNVLWNLLTAISSEEYAADSERDRLCSGRPRRWPVRSAPTRRTRPCMRLLFESELENLKLDGRILTYGHQPRT